MDKEAGSGRTGDELPEGCTFYREARTRDGRVNRLFAFDPPSGAQLCRSLTGSGEDGLVQRILRGEFNFLFGDGGGEAWA